MDNVRRNLEDYYEDEDLDFFDDDYYEDEYNDWDPDDVEGRIQISERINQRQYISPVKKVRTPHRERLERYVESSELPYPTYRDRVRRRLEGKEKIGYQGM